MNANREIVPADLVEKMTVAVTLGNDKATLGVELTAHQAEFFDVLEAEVRELQAAGMTIDIAHEIPEVVTTGLVSTTSVP